MKIIIMMLLLGAIFCRNITYKNKDLLLLTRYFSRLFRVTQVEKDGGRLCVGRLVIDNKPLIVSFHRSLGHV